MGSSGKQDISVDITEEAPPSPSEGPSPSSPVSPRTFAIDWCATPGTITACNSAVNLQDYRNKFSSIGSDTPGTITACNSSANLQDYRDKFGSIQSDTPLTITACTTACNSTDDLTKYQPREHQASVSSVASTVDTLKKEKLTEEPPYHIFTSTRKKQLVYIVSLAALFSPLSSNIYFPALGQIATDLHVSLASIALTITIYMIVQGIAPLFWGSLSDTVGRRSVYIATFIVYLSANIGCALAPNFVALMVFRGLQAAGSAATIAIGAGVIGDITESKERGGLIGIFGGLRMMGQSVGPVFGGILTEYLGYHSIFWFLTIFGGLVLLTILVFLPETLRTIAGSGTTRLHGVHKPWIQMIRGQPDVTEEAPPRDGARRVGKGTVLDPLRFLFEKDVFVTLFYGSIIYTIWSMVTSSTTSLFEEHFHLSNLHMGLAFLPNGAGCILGSTLTGKLMDSSFSHHEAAYRSSHPTIPSTTPISAKTHPSFPIEAARMRFIFLHLLVFSLSTLLYGFSITLFASPQGSMSFALVLQFLIAYTATAVFSMNSALVIDLFPGRSASATAVNNLVRCSVGAVGVWVVQVMLDSVGERWTFGILAGVSVGLGWMVGVELWWGPGWRRERGERIRRRERERQSSV